MATFAVYTLWSGGQLTPSTAFVSLSLFNLMRWPLCAIPMALLDVVRAAVSFQRISQFLTAENLQSSSKALRNPRSDMSSRQMGEICSCNNLQSCKVSLVMVAFVRVPHVNSIPGHGGGMGGVYPPPPPLIIPPPPPRKCLTPPKFFTPLVKMGCFIVYFIVFSPAGRKKFYPPIFTPPRVVKVPPPPKTKLPRYGK